MTLLQALSSISIYPIPALTIEVAGTARGLILTDTADVTNLNGEAYELATADLYLYLYGAPDIKEQDSAITQADRVAYLNLARAIYAKYGESKAGVPRKIGFLGENFSL